MSTRTPNLYGYFESYYQPENIASIDRLPLANPYILSHDELPQFQLPSINASSQIRLISLLPAESNIGPDSMDPIQCTIAEHDLDTAPAYEALSYTWGGIHRHLPISVLSRDADGQQTEAALFATPQLMTALRRLRRTAPRVLWIDQLCIDQDSKEEQGPQIQLMGEVYRKAEQVVIWLGEDAQDWTFENRLAAIERDGVHIAHLVAAFEERSQEPQDGLTLIKSLANFGTGGGPIDARRGRAIFRLLNRPWFRRAWVFQEASLARHLLVQFGLEEVRFETLLKVCDAMSSLAKEMGMHTMVKSSLEMSTGGYEMMSIIQQTRQQSRGNAEPNTTGKSFLSKLLQVHRRVQCHDQRDLIFAFLAFQGGEGIVATGGANVQPVEEVWRLAAEKIIRTSGSLDIFAAIPGTAMARTLPSWVPYWSEPFRYSRPIALPGSRFRACRGRQHEWIPSTDPNKLHVRGKIIDTVQVILNAHHPWDQFAIYKHSVWLFSGYDLLLQGMNRYLYFTPGIQQKLGDYIAVKSGSFPRDLARTLLADGALGEQQPLRKVHRHVELFSKNMGDMALALRRGEKPMTEEARELLSEYGKVEDLVLVAERKSIFFTEHLQLGMAAKAIEAGDVVAILHGSAVPCVLRKADGEGEYQVISQCYLNEWMYGESPREVWGKDPTKNPHPHGRWWTEEPDEFILVGF